MKDIQKLGERSQIIYYRGPEYTPGYPLKVRLFAACEGSSIAEFQIPWGYKLSPKCIIFQDKVYTLSGHVEDSKPEQEADHRSVIRTSQYYEDPTTIVVDSVIGKVEEV